MNRIYRTIFSRTLGAWIVVSEQAKTCAKRGTVGVVAALVLAPAAALGASLPTDGHIVSGQGSIATHGNDMTITQGSNKLGIDWSSFNIGSNNNVTFVQPSSHAVALNRVTGGDASAILGSLNANGQVFLVNPNGILFGQGASVNVGGLVASTLDLPIKDFEKGNYRFKGNGSPASVVNQGTLTANDGGAVALLGGTVSNQGVIVAKQGTVALAAGNAMTLDFAGDGLLNVQVDESVANALAENKQLIRTPGGQVVLTAKASDALLQTVVNNTGVIEAQTLGNKEGKIVLLGGDEGGTVRVAGTLDASAPLAGNGGFVETSGAHVQVAAEANVTTKSTTGKTGTWVIDPTDFNVTKGTAGQTDSGIGADTLSANLENTSVTLATVATGSGAGDINVNAAVSWKADTRLTLNAHGDINVNAPITATGSNAGLSLNHGGSGGTGAAAAGTDYNVKAPITLSGENASLSINGQAYTLIHSMVQLDAIDSTGVSGQYALASDLDAGGTTYRSALIGDSGNRFTGTLAGLGHTINDLTINAASSNFVGLFGFIGPGGTVRDLGLVGGSIKGGYGTGAIAAYNVGGTISHVQASTTVSGGQFTGGLVGANYDVTSILTDSYSTGDVSGTFSVGGLVGTNIGTVSQAYATGNVTGTSGVAGLVGSNSGKLSNVYATGAVSASGTAGALVASFSGADAVLSNAYWDSGSSGQANAIGANMGGTVSNVSDISSNRYSYTGYGNLGTWSLASGSGNVYVAKDSSGSPTWIMIEGQTRPFLTSEYSTSVGNAHQLQLMAYDLTANYSLTADIDASQTSGSDLSGMWSSLGFSPIGRDGNYYGPGAYYNVPYFTGSLDGQSHTVANLTMARPMETSVGLIGALAPNGTVKNLILTDANVSGGQFTGGLVGFNQGSVTNAAVSGAVSGIQFIGGLTGVNFGSVLNAYTDVDASGNDYVGGGVQATTQARSAPHMR